jgi:hypothetical protein
MQKQIFKFCFALIIVITNVLPNSSIGQHYFRLRADFSIKEKFNDGKMSLTMGSVLYDRTYRKLVYHVTFPKKEDWVIMDTVFYRIVDNVVMDRQFVPMLPSSTIFEFALQNNLDNFGLEKSSYKLDKVERDADMVLTTWLPDKRLAKALGKIIVSKRKGKLVGVAFYTPKDELVKKQIFKGFIKSSGVEFPAEVIEILYKVGGKETKVSTFKNLRINELNDDALYNFVIPASK